jgi:general secretion pathway protein K
MLVLAMAAAAAALMALSSRSLTHIAALQGAAQGRLYLGAGEPLVASVLEQDHTDAPEVDHLGETWATEGYSVPVDRGQLAGRIHDLQGRFNLNWLSREDDLEAGRAFQRLVDALDLPATLGPAVRDFLHPDGPRDPAPYVNRPVPVRAAGGPVARVDDIRAVSGMTDRALARLRPHLAALPADTALNVNTATAPVLAAVVASAGPRGAERLVQRRDAAPVKSAGAFARQVRDLFGPAAAEALPAGRIAVRSNWFAARLEVTLDATRRRRMIVLYRAPQSGDVSIAYRVNQP